MRPLQDFLKPVEVEGVEKPFPVQAYAVDKPCGNNGTRLMDQFGMGSSHCCDYIYVNNSEVLLLEDSNLKAKKDQLKNECFCSVQDEQTKEKLSRKRIREEYVLKAYASLLLLCRLISKDKDARQLMENKEVRFCVIINDSHASDSRAFQNLGNSISGSLGSLVSRVFVWSLEQAENKFSQYARFNS